MNKKKKTDLYVAYKRLTWSKDTQRLKVKGWKEMFYTYGTRTRWWRSMPFVDSACLLALARHLKSTGPDTLASAIKVERGHKNDAHQCLHPWGESHQAPAPPADTKISKWISFMYNLVTFQIADFVLVPRVSESAHKIFKRSLSSLQPFGSPGHEPHWFSKPDVLGAHLSIAGPKG